MNVSRKLRSHFLVCLFGIIASAIFACPQAVAQCAENCGTCQECSTGSHGDTLGSGPSQCGNIRDWDNSFYRGERTMFDFEVCDSCCGRPYISIFGGATTIEDFFSETETAPNTFDQVGVNLFDGYVVGGSLGFRVHQNLRLETEYSYRFNSADTGFTAMSINGSQTPQILTPATGRVFSHAGMFNALYDFSQRRVGCFNLYGGGGIGVLTIDAAITNAGMDFVSDDSQFAYQFIAGVNFPRSERIEWFGEYRFLAAEDLDVFDAAAGTPFGDFDYESHSLLFGIRINR